MTEVQPEPGGEPELRAKNIGTDRSLEVVVLVFIAIIASGAISMHLLQRYLAKMGESERGLDELKKAVPVEIQRLLSPGK